MTDITTNADAAATYTGIVVEYSNVDAALAILRDRYADVVFPVDTKDGMKDAKEVRSKLVKLRTGLEAKRKEIKEPALRRAQAIDAEAKAITAAIKAIEDPIDAQIKVEEARIEAEKEAKRQAEAARVAAIREKIDGIRALPLALAGASSDDIAAEKAALEGFTPTEEVFAEFTDDCKAAIAEALAAMSDLHARVMAQEAAAALVQAERLKLEEARRQAEAELAAEREALAEARAALARERAEIEAMRAAQIQQQMRALDEAEDKAIVAAPAVVPTGAETEQADEEAAPVASLFEDEPEATPAAPVADWAIRQAAIHTAAQFTAMAGKVEQCGFIDFAVTLRTVANGLRDGSHDAALAQADRDALIAADTLLLDATAECIEVLSEQQAAA